jgi:hypothetical protein
METWKKDLVEKWKKIVEKTSDPDIAMKGVQLIDFALTHDLGERPRCPGCGQIQKNHTTTCQHKQ